MNTTQTAIAIDAIATLNFDAIKTKLMHGASGEGWSAAHANTVETEYRRFLTLMKLYPNDANAPLVDVDTFWHYHILDTAKYAADCAAAFGYFLHHYPYLGMQGADSDADRAAAGARTGELYAATFGAAPTAPVDAAWCGAAAPALAWCGAATAKPAAQGLAWCGAATSQKPAWCGASSAAQQLAWCGAASSAPVTQLAWCGAANSAPAKETLAWCGAATAQRLQVSEDIVLTAVSSH
jgi:hypothetical protein